LPISVPRPLDRPRWKFVWRPQWWRPALAAQRIIIFSLCLLSAISFSS
jgi:hypothetical protein